MGPNGVKCGVRVSLKGGSPLAPLDSCLKGYFANDQDGRTVRTAQLHIIFLDANQMIRYGNRDVVGERVSALPTCSEIF